MSRTAVAALALCLVAGSALAAEGRNGNKVFALPLDALKDVMRKHGWIEE